MSQPSKTVFVLGAGFTRAFFPKAPLQVDHYAIEPLFDKYKDFDLARRVLEWETERADEGKINIERLLTRLEGMPHDREDARLQFNLLKSDVHRIFRERLKDATANGKDLPKELTSFARHCINNRITCISFNYDDVLDKALALVAMEDATTPIHGSNWNPDAGYGFFCESSPSILGERPWVYNRLTAMYLLKLHGSMNWRIKLGYTKPYPIDAVVHHERWKTPQSDDGPTDKAIEFHLTGEPFIVPPVLGKSALEEPLLQSIWGKARTALRDADDGVVFVGYSCPVTDLAASFLFSDTVPLNGSNVTVVNKAENPKSKQQVKEVYQNLFPRMQESGFQFIDALEWAQDLGNHSM